MPEDEKLRDLLKLFAEKEIDDLIFYKLKSAEPKRT
jgi:hypothetical protein